MRTLLMLLLAAAPLTGWAQDLEPLPPEQAFRVTAVADDGGVRLDWDLEPGYYLYRKRFAFETGTPGMTLGEPEFPAGDIHEDEFFGRSEIYRGRFSVHIPVERSPGAGTDLELSIRSQGCADLGLCYPPQTWIRSVSLPPASSPAGGNLLSLIGTRSDNGEFLPPDQAFHFTAETVSRGWVELDWQIAEGYYLYKHSLTFEALGENQSVGQPVIPAGEPKEDEFFGRTEVFHNELSVRLPVQAPAGRPLELRVGYQGCAEDGICYPPIKRDVALDLSDAPTAEPAGSAAGPVSEQDRLAGLIRDGALPWVALTFFGFGLLLAFTPCVLPMVPILSSIIVGQGPSVDVRRAFSLSLAFVLAMALTYTAAGVVVALLGQNLQAAFQHPLVLLAFSAIFVALSLAMFGLYELQMPAALQTRLTEASQKQASGTLVGAGVMGVLSALIVGPCVAAPLAAALIVIGQSGDAFRGGTALFALSLGMGTPLLAFGASAGKLLPKAGPWMEAVKKFFGLLLLGVAIWMIERIVPSAVAMALWGLLVLLAALLMTGIGSKSPARRPANRWIRIAGLAALAYGLAILVGAATGATSPLRPLEGLAGDSRTTGLEFRQVKTTADLDRELAAAGREGRLAMLDFYADWCVDCRKMERYTFTDPAVVAALDGVVLLQADVTANDDADQALLKRFGIFGPPTIAFFAPDGAELGGYRQVGFAPAAEFASHVASLRAGAP